MPNPTSGKVLFLILVDEDHQEAFQAALQAPRTGALAAAGGKVPMAAALISGGPDLVEKLPVVAAQKARDLGKFLVQGKG